MEDGMITEPAVLSLDDEITAGISVRGVGGAEAKELAKPHLDEWQGQQIGRLPDGCHFQSSDTVTPPSGGQQTVSRTLKVIADEDAE